MDVVYTKQNDFRIKTFTGWHVTLVHAWLNMSCNMQQPGFSDDAGVLGRTG